MKQVHFDRLVIRLEGFAREQPRLYSMCVWLLAMLGYGYIIGIVLVLCASVAAVIGILIYLAINLNTTAVLRPLIEVSAPVTVVLVTMIWQIMKSLRVHLPPPQGQAVERHHAQRLYAMIDEVAGKLKAPSFERIIIDADFNAAVVQVPRFGVLGFQRNFLVIGLPYMQALSPEEFKSVIAHELGHISRNHSRFSGWIYRLRKTWFRLLVGYNGHPLLSIFFRWYAPYFAAYTFVLARTNEYIADSCAVQVVGAEVSAQALVDSHIKGHYLGGEIWPDNYKKADTEAYPTAVAPFTAMFDLLAAGPKPADAEDILQAALTEKPQSDDTHPALYQRLAAIGYRITPGGPLDPIKLSVPPSPPFKQSAAVHYLGAFARKFADAADKQWRQDVHRDWIEQHKKAQWALNSLHALKQRSRTEPMTYDDIWKMAHLIGRFEGDEAAMPVLKELLAKAPHHFEAAITLGRLQAERGNREGLALLERAKLMKPEHAEAVRALIVRLTKRCKPRNSAPAGVSPRPGGAQQSATTNAPTAEPRTR